MYTERHVEPVARLIIKRRPDSVRRRLNAVGIGAVRVSSITLGELRFGRHARDPIDEQLDEADRLKLQGLPQWRAAGARDTLVETGSEVLSEAGGFVVETAAIGLHSARRPLQRL